MNLTGLPLAKARAESDRLVVSSIPALFRERVAEAGDAVALRYKDRGVYRSLTWSDYFERTRHVGGMFAGFGVKADDTIAIMGDPSVEYILSHMAGVVIGAIPYGIYPTSSASETAYLLQHGGARVAVVGDQEHLDKLLAAERDVGRRLLDHIVLIDARTRFVYDDARIVPFHDLTKSGSRSDSLAREVDRRIDRVSPDSIVGLIFTSGTTANPKGAYYTHAGMLVGLTYGLLEVMPDLRTRRHRVVTHLPLAHGMGQALSLFVPLMADVIQHLPERGQSLTSLMREVRPTHFLGVPRIWQKSASQILVEVENAGPLRRKLFSWAEAVGERRARQRCNGESMTRRVVWGGINALAHSTMVWPALYKAGLAHVRGAASGGAPIPTGVASRWQAWGIPLRNVYGSTEAGMMGSAATIWADPEAPLHPPYPRRIEASDDNEVVVSGNGIFAGYWRDEAGTLAAFDQRGRVKTGDVASFVEDGSFRIVDRKKDILITSGGKNVSPATVESALKTSPYISEAIIFGDGEKYLSALIEINFDSIASWARANDIQYTGFTNLISNDRVVRLIRKEIDTCNRLLSRPEQVKQFRIIPKELDPEDGDTTATRKIKRVHAYNMFKSLVDSMYQPEQN